MFFSFDESEILNSIFQSLTDIPPKEDFLNIIEKIIELAEDNDLKLIYTNIHSKLLIISEERFKNLSSNLPVDTISVY